MYKTFKDMPVWINTIELINKIYDITNKFPGHEAYVLSSQLRRASISISGNIAESFGRYHSLDKVNFLYYARGSLCETENYLLIANKQGYLSDECYSKLVTDISKIHFELNSLIKALRIKILNKP